MSSKHLVHPELLPGLELIPTRDIGARQMEMIRQMGLARPPSPEVADVDCTERLIAAPPDAPQVRVLIYRPKAAPATAPAILHIHGGGYILGDPEGSDGANRLLASDLACVIVSVAYRLAPETPFPGPVEDCYAALKWLHASAGELGVDAARIAIKGESAGGGLAAGLAILARDRGEVPIVLQVLTYPMIDDRPASDPHPFTGEFIWTANSNRFGWESLLGHPPGQDGVSPYAAAARLEDFAGLAPAFIATGALDLFLDENLDYARRLTRGGVPTELHVYPGAYHGFELAGATAVSRRYSQDYRLALGVAFGLTAD